MNRLPLIFAILTFVLIGVGLVFKRKRKVHIPCMLSAFAVELVIVYLLESGRHVIDRAMQGPPPLLIIHVTLAMIIILLYLSMIVSGCQIIYRDRWWKAHLMMACCLVPLKVINFILSMLVKQ